MSKFRVEKIEEIDGKIEFFKLVKNNKCEFEEFIEKYSRDGNLKSELIKMQSTLQNISEGKKDRIPESKFKVLKGRRKNDLVKDYEVKTKNLRLYFFTDESGRIIVLGGKKGTQKRDIKKLRSIKKEYLQEKK